MPKGAAGVVSVEGRVFAIEEHLAKLDGKLAKLEEVDSLIASVSFLNTEVEDLKKTIEELRNNNRKLVDENRTLQKKNDDLEQQVEELDSYIRRNNLEIRNVPVRSGENTDAIIETIAKVLDVKLESDSLEASHRLPSRNANSKSIVARFINRKSKEEIIAKARKTRLSTKDLNFPGPAVPIFINEQLTPKSKDLFFAALTAKKANNWRFLWTSNGKILARKNTDSQAVLIKTKEDLRLFSI